MQIGVLGATGPAGSALAARLAASGYEVIIGSRSKDRAMEARNALVERRWPDRNLPISFAENIGAAGAEVVVLATKWDAAAPTAAEVADQLQGKIVICMANALTRVGKEFQPLVPPRGSVAAWVQAAVPGARVVAAFHHVPARELGDLTKPVESDVLVCSDDGGATEAVCEIVGRLPDLRPLDAGLLSNAGPVEAFVAVLLQLGQRYRTRAAVKFTGIKP